MVEPGNIDILVILARLEGKVDTLIASQTDHEARIRTLEQKTTVDPVSYEARMHAVEQKSTVSPKTLWAALLGASTMVGVISQVVYVATQR